MISTLGRFPKTTRAVSRLSCAAVLGCALAASGPHVAAWANEPAGAQAGAGTQVAALSEGQVSVDSADGLGANVESYRPHAIKFGPCPEDASLDCGTNSAVLGQASATKIVRNFTNAPQQNVWYPIALASALAGSDLNNGAAHIQAQFSSQIDQRQRPTSLSRSCECRCARAVYGDRCVPF